MEVLVKAIDKAQREGVYTLEEISIILRELNTLEQITKEHKKLQEEYLKSQAEDKKKPETGEKLAGKTKA